MPSSTVENYLKAIWSLQQGVEDGQLVPVGQIADKLYVTPGTATTMMQQLFKKELIRYTPRKGVALNEAGKTAALRVLRRHRLVESFLVEIMKLDWAEVHDDAEVLEHVISDRLLARMDEMLNHPTHDPHGAPIPSADGTLQQDRTSSSLADCAPGHYTLTRVRENKPAFLQWLARLGLKPGSAFELTACDIHADTLTLSLPEYKEPIMLSRPAAQALLVAQA